MKKTALFNLIFITSIFSFSTSYAQEKVVTPDKYPDSERFFESVGKGYIAKEDNEFIIKKYGINFGVGIQAFLRTPDKYACKNELCDRKSIYSETKLIVESIVYPSALEHSSLIKDKLDCEHNILTCYYKVKFEDGDIGYMQVYDFNKASSGSPYIFTSPWQQQLIPIKPNQQWLKDKKRFDKYFKSIGVQEGFTKEQVLKSNWGKPSYKTRSSSGGSKIEVWSYSSGGMLGFVDGYLTDITTVE